MRNTSLIDTGGLSLKKRRARASSVGYSTVSYDPAGNEFSYVASRSYSPRNLLDSVTDASESSSNTHLLEYGYDGRGIRLIRSETQSDGTRASRYYTYSPDLQLLSVTADDGPNVWATRIRATSLPPTAQEFVWFGGRPLAQFASDAGPALRWYYNDHLGTPLIETDSNGSIVWQAECEPYGGIWKLRAPIPQDEIQSPRIEQPLRFPGQDVAMNWEGSEENYNIFRWYRAGWGRYTQSDPIGLDGGTNVFAYVGDNPVLLLDLLGLKCCHPKSVTATRFPVQQRNKIAIGHHVCFEVGKAADCDFGQWLMLERDAFGGRNFRDQHIPLDGGGSVSFGSAVWE
ncbi:MAG: RHS repeat domain-containing protein, partial [Thermoanaerobaculia bacterium]